MLLHSSTALEDLTVSFGLGTRACTFAGFYRLDANANSTRVGKRMLMLAGSSVGVGSTYPGSTTFIGRVELNTSQDTSILAVTLGATTALAYTSAHVIMIMRWNTSLARLSGIVV